jgi:outer membrane lipoprotein-sorting protein
MIKSLKIFILLIFPALSAAQTQKPELLTKLQDEFNSIESVSANFVQKNEGNVNLSGRLFFKKENNIRCDLGNILIVSNGKTSWNYNKKLDKVVISNYDSTNPSIFSLRNIILSFPAKCKVTDLSTDSLKVLELIPMDNSVLNFKKAKIFITKNNLPQKLLVTNSNNNIIEIDLSDYKLDSALPNSYFSFIPPKGCKIIDLR